MHRTPSRQLTDPEFQAILVNDPELRRLDQFALDSGAEFALLLDALGCRFGIGALPVRPLTAAGWAFLWTIGNGYARDIPPTQSDMDVALYVLSRDVRDLRCRPEELPARASGYAAQTGVPLGELTGEIAAMISTAFSPLAMIPAEKGGANKPVTFDADWLVRTAAIAAREGNVTIDQAMFEMPLSRVTLLFVAFLRRKSLNGDKIGRVPSQDVTRAIMRRIDLLQNQYLKG